MSGKICTGVANNNAFRIKNNCHRAFSDGMYHRAQGTAAAFPQSDNPFDGEGSERETAWDEGWAVAHAAAPGAIARADAGCAAPPSGNISA